MNGLVAWIDVQLISVAVYSLEGAVDAVQVQRRTS
jgi:hypothetical protein